MSTPLRPSSKNAIKCGVAATGWLDPDEQSQYQALVDQLTAECRPPSVLMRIAIDRLATALVRRGRLQRAENALYEKSRLAHAQLAVHRTPHSVGSYFPDTEDGRARALTIMRDAALPDLERISLLNRYITGLDRQVSKAMDEIQQLGAAPYASPAVSGGGTAGRLTADINAQDAQPKRRS
jgi:hypothetical protein